MAGHSPNRLALPPAEHLLGVCQLGEVLCVAALFAIQVGDRLSTTAAIHRSSRRAGPTAVLEPRMFSRDECRAIGLMLDQAKDRRGLHVNALIGARDISF